MGRKDLGDFMYEGPELPEPVDSLDHWIQRADRDICSWVLSLQTSHIGGARAYVEGMFEVLHHHQYSFSHAKDIVGSLVGIAAQYRSRELHALEIACRVVREAVTNTNSAFRKASAARGTGKPVELVRRIHAEELARMKHVRVAGGDEIEGLGRRLYTHFVAPLQEPRIVDVLHLNPWRELPSRSVVPRLEVNFDREEARRQKHLLQEEGEVEEGLRLPERRTKDMEY